MSDDIKGAILQRDKETYAIRPRTPVGLMTPEILEGIAKVVRKHNIPIVKITSGQRIALVGIKKDEIDPILSDLRLDIGRQYVQACPGTAVCTYGMQDSLDLGMELEKLFYDAEFPAKVKIGVSGCPLCCGESLVRDVGIIGKKKGWTVAFGGNAGCRPRIADILAQNIGKDEVLNIVKKALEYYKLNGKKKERTARFIERTGIEALKEYIAKG